MRNIRIYTLARELKLDNAAVINIARELGANVGTASSAITETIAAQIRERITSSKGSRAQDQPKAHAQPARTASEEKTATSTEPSSQPVARQSHPRQRTSPPRESGGSSRRKPSEKPVLEEAEALPAPAPGPGQPRSPKRLYLIDGLNVCNWQKTPSLAPLLTLLIELKRQGHQFLCIFDANTRFVLDDLGERDKYEHLLTKYDCFGEVPGGTQADDFLLFRAHKTGDAIVTNDQYRDQKYRERYKWLRSVSPRLCKGMVLGGFLILPELDVHARVRESVAGAVKDFEDAFGTGAHRERQPDHRQPHGTHRSTQPRAAAQPKREEPAAKVAAREPEPPPPAVKSETINAEALAPGEPGSAGELGTSTEQRPRSRRRRRRGGRRGGGGAQVANGGGQGGESQGTPS